MIVSEPVYIIGIDLGTTNSVVAYTRVTSSVNEKSEINIFEVPQFTSLGVIEKRPVTPSFIYIPSEQDFSPDGPALPWSSDKNLIIGEYGRNRGAEIPQRLISSSKSWLCNTMIDRNKPLLPWGSPENIIKMSPVEASAGILQYIRDAWNHIMASQDDRLMIERQEIFLTVPASFDAIARELTVKAAELAGLSNITLLEEPQAAFYSWIESSGDQWRKNIHKGDIILICDIGGGTSDFSLIEVAEDHGDLILERIAVGDHLMVGGDNMDLAAAYFVARRLAESGTRLDPWQMRMMVHGCRNAKENLLSGDDLTTQYPVTVLGRGSSLIGGTLKTILSRDDIQNLIVDGFFPNCDLSSMPKENQKIGLRETGLSYEADPSITRHMAKFLNRNKPKNQVSGLLPSAVLFNGGVMKSPAIRQRIMDLIGHWKSDEGNDAIREISANEFDLAVARGAVYYGLARHGAGIRIRGGLGRSYYIGIAASMPAVPGMPQPVKALCVAPFGMEEGTGDILKQQEFILVVGEPVRFDFLSSMIRHEDDIGQIVEDWQNQLEEITSLETSLDGPPGSIIRVSIEIKVTEIGTLELWCVSVEDGRKWKLEFNVREQD
jgi:molecular chaperone DnaK (HSP70)